MGLNHQGHHCCSANSPSSQGSSSIAIFSQCAYFSTELSPRYEASMSFFKSLFGANTGANTDGKHITNQSKQNTPQSASKPIESKSQEPFSGKAGGNAGSTGQNNPNNPQTGARQTNTTEIGLEKGIQTSLSRLGSAFSSVIQTTTPTSAGKSDEAMGSSTRIGQNPIQGPIMERPRGAYRMPPEIQRQTAKFSEPLFESILLLFNWSGYVESEANRMCGLYSFWKNRPDPDHIHLDRLNEFLEKTIPKDYFRPEKPQTVSGRDANEDSVEIGEGEGVSEKDVQENHPNKEQNEKQESTIATAVEGEEEQGNRNEKETLPASSSAASEAARVKPVVKPPSKPVPASQRGLPQQAALALYDAHRMKCHLESEAAQTATLNALSDLTKATSDLRSKMDVVIEAANAKRQSRIEIRKELDAEFKQKVHQINEIYSKKKVDLVAFHERNMGTLAELEKSPLPLPALQISVSVVPDPNSLLTPTSSAPASASASTSASESASASKTKPIASNSPGSVAKLMQDESHEDEKNEDEKSEPINADEPSSLSEVKSQDNSCSEQTNNEESPVKGETGKKKSDSEERHQKGKQGKGKTKR